MRKMIRDNDGKDVDFNKVSGKEYRRVLFESCHYHLGQLAASNSKQEVYESLSELIELQQTLIGTLVPRNAAAYEALHNIGKDKATDHGGYFKGYYEEVSQ